MAYRKRTGLLLFFAIAIAIVNAAVFAYYPMSITFTGYQPVQFSPGKNANQPDLGTGNNIVVNIGQNSASVSITVHPTYQNTYYKNITLIRNIDTAKAYYIAFRVVTPFSFPTGSQAKLIIYDATYTTQIIQVNLLATGTTAWVGPLPANSKYIVDLYFFYPEGNPLPTSATAQVQLIFSPQNTESAPTVPP